MPCIKFRIKKTNRPMGDYFWNEIEKIRDSLHAIVAKVLKVKKEEIEINVDEGHILDVNSPEIGIVIITGYGKNNWRLNQKDELAKEIAKQTKETGLFRNDWLKPGPDGAYIWLNIVGSGFVPIGHPEDAR